MFLTAIILFSSCVTYKNERSTYFPGTEPLSRSDYYTLGDASVEATVQTTFGFLHSTQTGKNYKRGYIGHIKREGGSILIGKFKINMASLFTASAFTFGSSFLINRYSGKVNNISSNRYGQARIPYVYALIPGTAIGMGLNNMFASTPTNKAVDLANYNFLDQYKADYLLNPRYSIEERSTMFTKTATVKLTSKSITIKADKKFKK